MAACVKLQDFKIRLKSRRIDVLLQGTWDETVSSTDHHRDTTLAIRGGRMLEDYTCSRLLKARHFWSSNLVGSGLMGDLELS